MTVERMTAFSAGLRRSGRLSREVPIILSGADTEGRQFSESTRTLVLSLHGASVISHHKLIPEQEIFLRVVSTNREIEVRVCGEIGEREDGHIYGIAFADPELDFWQIEFPAAESFPRNLISITLACSACHSPCALRFDGTELDVYAVNEGMLRFCSQCGFSTIWKIATENPAPKKRPAPKLSIDAEASSAKPAQSEVSLAVNAPAAPPNRRKERRTKVKVNACIRDLDFSEEIVPCQDMSRGGFSFHSSREYSLGTTIEASVPYSPGGIFVPARIVNVRHLQNGKLFRYGVAYLRDSKK